MPRRRRWRRGDRSGELGCAHIWAAFATSRAVGRRRSSTAAQAIAEAESVGELSALAHACYALDWALVESGRPDEATHSWRALEIYEQLGDPEHEFLVLNNLGGIAYWDDRWDEAVELYQPSRRVRGTCRQTGRRAFTDGNVGEILSDQGTSMGPRRIYSGPAGSGARPATGNAVAYVDALLARLAVRRGQYARGLAMLEAAMSELRQARDRRLRRARPRVDRRSRGVRRRSVPSDGDRKSGACRRTIGSGRCSREWAGSRSLVSARRRPRCANSGIHWRRRGIAAPTTTSPPRSTPWRPSTAPIPSCCANGTRSWAG